VADLRSAKPVGVLRGKLDTGTSSALSPDVNYSPIFRFQTPTTQSNFAFDGVSNMIHLAISFHEKQFLNTERSRHPGSLIIISLLIKLKS